MGPNEGETNGKHHEKENRNKYERKCTKSLKNLKRRGVQLGFRGGESMLYFAESQGITWKNWNYVIVDKNSYSCIWLEPILRALKFILQLLEKKAYYIQNISFKFSYIVYLWIFSHLMNEFWNFIRILLSWLKIFLLVCSHTHTHTHAHTSTNISISFYYFFFFCIETCNYLLTLINLSQQGSGIGFKLLQICDRLSCVEK